MGYAILQKMLPMRVVLSNNLLPCFGNKFTGMFALPPILVRLLHIPGSLGVLCFHTQ